MMFPLGFISQGGGGGGAGGSSMELISTIVVGVAATTVTFSSIPSTYSHLQIRAVVKDSNAGSTADNGNITFNGDTTATNYYWHSLEGNGSGANAYNQGSYLNSLRNIMGSVSAAQAYSSQIIDILDYSKTTKYKTMRTLNGLTNSTYSAWGVGISSALWQNTAAISTIALSATGANTWLTGSRFSLYGIKG